MEKFTPKPREQWDAIDYLAEKIEAENSSGDILREAIADALRAPVEALVELELEMTVNYLDTFERKRVPEEVRQMLRRARAAINAALLYRRDPT